MLRASKIERGSCLQESTTTIRCTTFGSVWSVTVWFLKTAESIVVMLNHTSRRCPENSLLHALYTQYNDSLSPPSIPKVSVDWYYNGGIFKSPTVLGGIGVGDAFNGQGSNAEAIVPLDEMYRNIKNL